MPDSAAHSLYDVFKDFQPTFAAVIALVAATIAYVGATSKTRFDHRVSIREHEREKLGLLLRLRYEVVLIRTLVRGIAVDKDIDAKLATGAFATPDRDGVNSAKLMIDTCPAIDAAWQKVQLFPIDLVGKIDVLRRHMLRISLAFDPNIYPVYPDPTSVNSVPLTRICAALLEGTATLEAELTGLIEKSTSQLKALK
jgi:hypothetical protein